ncbi:L-amino acid N-acyltransferase YncA [Pedobacter westerhofensis]|uniref:L-amino acid N-acyltransferase YncA n=1 Tax=Pedobacter westerhofensis TaxID=425512 RepID=A0A521FBC8_9SPHI|nr:GNAT family N-acetyltransferase [Pedobacter westerhofensis]SMO93436.1 L-amino acid N-acyltransferase YncA [Pedobacter westerhofensis]
MEYSFRKAVATEQDQIWEILQQGILRRKMDGSNQWQDGYPNPEVVKADIEKGQGFVLTFGETIVGYTAIIINDEPAYHDIEGQWLTNGDFVVYHRVAISEDFVGRGLSKKILQAIDEFALNNHIHSVRADTNHDNIAMLKTFEKMGYTYCGEVFFRGSARKAFEKVLPAL